MKKIQIIAHRGAFLPEGPIPTVQNQFTIPENKIESFKRAFENGWGIETDVRLTNNGQFILIHDSNLSRLFGEDINSEDLSLSQLTQYSIPLLDQFCQLARSTNNIIAFQIKRGDAKDCGIKIGIAIAQSIQKYDLKNSIIFDATLEEAKFLRDKFPWLNLSVSVGEDNFTETIYIPKEVLSKEFSSVYTSVWADEWKTPYSINNKALFEKLRTVYPGRIDIISPELHYLENHPFSKDLEHIKKLWIKLSSFGLIDGICTDYPTTLSSVI